MERFIDEDGMLNPYTNTILAFIAVIVSALLSDVLLYNVLDIYVEYKEMLILSILIGLLVSMLMFIGCKIENKYKKSKLTKLYNN